MLATQFLALLALAAPAFAQSARARIRRDLLNEYEPAHAALEKRQATARMGRRRSLNILCSEGFEACVTPGSSLTQKAGYECVNIMEDLEACGGCPGTPASVDCTAIPGATAMSCVEGQCIVTACEVGYELVEGAGTVATCVL
ncbi:hypothetical protein MNV49_004911 [Pseudohyphozyma bogoriensis]|nr:hypothetical protein MNV49_004911 [Pseudohyphozyma bogoriensis]